MDSPDSIIELQRQVADLGSRLNLLSKWISIKFGDDPSFPAKLLSGPSSLLEFETDYHEGDADCLAVHSSFTNYISEPESQPIADTTGNRTHRRKQQLSNFKEPVFEVFPVSTVKEENEDQDDTDQRIRIVDMSSILNESADEPSTSTASRTRQPYGCLTCNRKFRSQALLNNHKMTHCYVQIRALDSIRIQPRLNEVPNPESEPDPEHGTHSDDNMDFQAIDNDSVDIPEIRTNAKKRRARAQPNVGDFSCEICQKKFSKARYVKDHMIYKHFNEIRNKDSQHDAELHCPECQRKFASPRQVKCHMKNKHLNEYGIRYANTKQSSGDFGCSVCPKKFISELRLKEHLKRCHREVYDELLKENAAKRKARVRQTYHCKFCPDSFCTHNLLQEHRNGSHAAEILEAIKRTRKLRSVFKCKICKDGKNHNTEGRLKKHKAVVHSIPKPISVTAKCEECGATFMSRSGFLHHKQSVHLKSRPCLCPQCGKGFSRIADLRVHMDIHSEVRKYQCEECPQSFRQKVGLIIHRKRHSGAAQEQCVQCGQFFCNLSALRCHERDVHVGTRPFPCPKCSKCFKQRTHLNYHLKTHENPNGRKRGLNKERGVIQKRRNLTNELKVIPKENSSNTPGITENSEECTITSAEEQTFEVSAAAQAPPVVYNYTTVDVEGVVGVVNVLENDFENCVLSLVNF